jgi:uncharacterized protein (DUF2252 family)
MTGASPSALTGRQARKRAPLDVQGRWAAGAGGRDAVAVLEQHARGLAQDMVSLRFGRMLGSRFAFFAGAGAVMASDLSTTADTGLWVQLCGDAHVDNFAWFLRPDGHVFFDIDHFDETAPGPWEWDLKRFATSLEVAGRDRGLGDRQRSRLVRAAVDTYCEAIRELASHEYLALTAPGIQDEPPSPHIAMTAFRRAVHLTAQGGQGFHLVSSPPAVVRFTDAMDAEDRTAATTELKSDMSAYRRGLRKDSRQVLDRFVFADAASKLDDLSDIGRKTLLVLFVSRDRGEPLVLEVKEAGPSVLPTDRLAGGKSHAGRRVVEGRRLIDSGYDVLLGWFTGRGWYGVTRDYHVRQSWPRFIASPARIDVHALLPRARAAARTIARAHARSGDRVAIATYIGRGEAFPAAILRFAVAYAEQNELDYQALDAAVGRGRIVARDA